MYKKLDFNLKDWSYIHSEEFKSLNANKEINILNNVDGRIFSLEEWKFIKYQLQNGSLNNTFDPVILISSFEKFDINKDNQKNLENFPKISKIINFVQNINIFILIFFFLTPIIILSHIYFLQSFLNNNL